MIALFRHLPTTHDTTHVYSDWDANPPLAEVPKRILSRVRMEIHTFVHRFGVKGIYVSDNPRGKATVQCILQKITGLPQVHQDARLNNIRQPEWSGKSQAEVEKLPLYSRWHNAPSTVKFPGGESLADVAERIDSFFADVQHRPILILSHTTPMQVILCKTLGLSVENIWSFKFDHLAFSVTYKNILLRFNSERIGDIKLEDLRRCTNV